MSRPVSFFNVIRENHEIGERRLDLLRWGLIPHGCTDPDGGRKPINARAESVTRLPSFRAYTKRRCIRRGMRTEPAAGVWLMPLSQVQVPVVCLHGLLRIGEFAMAGMPKLDRDRVAKVVTEIPFQIVFLALSFAFLAGMGLAVILGPEAFRYLPWGLALYATACSFLCTMIFGLALVGTLRRRD
jgi:hypothetical protein